MKSWNGLMYVLDGVVILGAVTRETGVGPWQAWRCLFHDNVLIPGDFSTAEEAQRAVEKACEDL
jgi:hypothetical protein